MLRSWSWWTVMVFRFTLGGPGGQQWAPVTAVKVLVVASLSITLRFLCPRVPAPISPAPDPLREQAGVPVKGAWCHVRLGFRL